LFFPFSKKKKVSKFFLKTEENREEFKFFVIINIRTKRENKEMPV